jgi:hypothetical protein
MSSTTRTCPLTRELHHLAGQSYGNIRHVAQLNCRLFAFLHNVHIYRSQTRMNDKGKKLDYRIRVTRGYHANSGALTIMLPC